MTWDWSTLYPIYTRSSLCQAILQHLGITPVKHKVKMETEKINKQYSLK